MATPKRNFHHEYYYHIYNRGVEKRKIFHTVFDYRRFLDVILYYLHDRTLRFSEFHRLNPVEKEEYLLAHPTGAETLRVKTLAWTLMPNHFHLLLKPEKPHGITSFMSDISNSHTKYFNLKNERQGKLYQGTFKSKEVTDEPSVFQLTRYLHINATEADPTGTLRPENYPYSSYHEWLHPSKALIVDKEELAAWLKLAGGVDKYRKFVESKSTHPTGVEAGFDPV